jgi:hypothetical protein
LPAAQLASLLHQEFSAAKTEHAITHIHAGDLSVLPDIVANDTTNASARMLLEAKTAAAALALATSYGTRFAANGGTWMEALYSVCTYKAVVGERDVAAKRGSTSGVPSHVHPAPTADAYSI